MEVQSDAQRALCPARLDSMTCGRCVSIDNSTVPAGQLACTPHAADRARRTARASVFHSSFARTSSFRRERCATKVSTARLPAWRDVPRWRCARRPPLPDPTAPAPAEKKSASYDRRARQGDACQISTPCLKCEQWPTVTWEPCCLGYLTLLTLLCPSHSPSTRHPPARTRNGCPKRPRRVRRHGRRGHRPRTLAASGR